LIFSRDCYRIIAYGDAEAPEINEGVLQQLIEEVVDFDREYSPIEGLVELGRQKTYVTMDDILRFFPKVGGGYSATGGDF